MPIFMGAGTSVLSKAVSRVKQDIPPEFIQDAFNCNDAESMEVPLVQIKRTAYDWQKLVARETVSGIFKFEVV